MPNSDAGEKNGYVVMSNAIGNHTANVIQLLISHDHDITLFSKHFAYALRAEATALDTKSGLLALEVSPNGKDLQHYIRNGYFSFDIEAKGGPENHEKEVHSFDKIPAEIHKKDTGAYLIRCQLPESVFVTESRGAVRIPFILGMNAGVSISAYEAELNIEARVRNLSAGGCLADMSIEDSLSLYVGQIVPELAINFPNGEYYFSKGRIRHIRPFGSLGRAAVGIQFTDVSSAMTRDIFQYVSECEREAASRSGLKENITPSELFIPRKTKFITTEASKSEKSKMSRQPAMVPEVLKVAQQLKVVMMFIKNRDIFSEEALYDCSDTLIDCVKDDRTQLLYALSFLRGQPDWVRHAVQTAGVLADMLIARDPHSGLIRESVVGALIHNMGKPLLIGKQMPSLKINMNPKQRFILKQHPLTLLKKIDALGWRPTNACRDIIENANERLDGSGYPAAKGAADLSDRIKLLSVIKTVNKLTHGRNGAAPRPPLEAYRWIHGQAEVYDSAIVVEYIKHYGLYPIGSLARFPGGFLAWIMNVDAKGMPNQVQLTKNLAFKDTSIDTVLTATDFHQIGALEGIVNPEDFDIKPPH